MKRKIEWVSEARFRPFLEAVQENEDLAWELYEWNALMASTLSEVIHHVEVLVRNAMLAQLETVHPLEYPWNSDKANGIVLTADRLRTGRKDQPVTSDDVTANLNLGFWCQFVDPKSSENRRLWESCLSRAFPKSRNLASVSIAMEDLRELRNRCSHQDSLLKVNPRIELNKIMRLVGWIDPEAVEWITGISRVEKILEQKPETRAERNCLVFASNRAIKTESMSRGLRYPYLESFLRDSAIVVRSDISVGQSVEHVGFYVLEDKKDPNQKKLAKAGYTVPRGAHIAPLFPAIEGHFVPTEWSSEEADKLVESAQPEERRAGAIMRSHLGRGYREGQNYTIYFLADKSVAHTSATPIIHKKEGQGSAFVKSPRYFRLEELRSARETSDLNS